MNNLANAAIKSVATHIYYEQPLNERIRMLLRLEHLFAQMDVWMNGASTWHSRAILDSLFEIQSVLGRSDISKDLLKELERQAGILSQLDSNPNVDHQMLNNILDQLDLLTDRLHAIGGQPGQKIRDNEFLNTIQQRSTIAGGNCDFDLPAFHQWLLLPAEKRIDNISGWIADYLPIRDAIRMILNLIRDGATTTKQVAESGFYQQSLDTSIPYQLIRVCLPSDHLYFAEISAGKHRFTIRFMQMIDKAQRPVQSEQDIEFLLSCCQL